MKGGGIWHLLSILYGHRYFGSVFSVKVKWYFDGFSFN